MTTKKKKAPRVAHVHPAPPPPAYEEIIAGMLPSVIAMLDASGRSRDASRARADQHVERLDQLLTQQAALIRDLALAK